VAVERAGWSGFAERRAASAAKGRLRGIGIGIALTPVGYTAGDTARIRVESTGEVAVAIGNVSCGQGHETVAVRMVSRALGIDPGSVQVVQGDTERVGELIDANGGSTFLQSAGPALKGAADLVIEKGRRIAAHLMETGAADVEFRAGAFHVAGTDRRLRFAEVAAAAHEPGSLPADIAPGLDETHYHAATDTYPFGCHIAEVEVAPETGEVEIVGYTAVSDFGTIMNLGLVTGQIHGGIAQGIGQALSEHLVYGPEGELLAGSFMDYAMPRAGHCPNPDVTFIEDPTPSNPLGVKGCGEVPTSSAAPAVINAVLDAISPLGVTELQMPATPARVWEAIRRSG
jgi:carbon-monoxide dehydrogenase large subunit